MVRALSRRSRNSLNRLVLFMRLTDRSRYITRSIRQRSNAAAQRGLNEQPGGIAESRGIARPDAERMIALGFFNPVIARFPNAAVRELLTSALAAKLGAAEHVESAL